ncbi:hypothetical protein D7X32_18500 [Corallococcus carmarthensis]|uniref:Uncharacterized protein n=1 Tax=Corallococcus carmarthensis TaxID=2316728 RepID=A0A3A8K490_9BACT|nr:hypothetical protein D7X32_18500 [Corallococcus carmarthensis]
MAAMSFLNLPIHDAEVTGVRMDWSRALLHLELVLHTCERARVDFSGARWWSLARFERQNVLVDIHEWKAGNPATAERCRDLGVDAFWTRKVLADEYTLYEVAPSVGLGGYCLAHAAEVCRDAPVTASVTPPEGGAHPAVRSPRSRKPRDANTMCGCCSGSWWTSSASR